MSIAQAEVAPLIEATASPVLAGVHHTARPTWKLAETVRFYRDIVGLDLVHAISAKGWGPPGHPDFLHFFFDSGRGSTIAFFYYLGTDQPADIVEPGSWLYNSVHTAWRVDTREQLLAWRAHFEAHGLSVLQVPHEIIESIYVTDPNGYAVEIAWQTREMSEADANDAMMTLDAAIQLEAEGAGRVATIDPIWRRKASIVADHIAKAA